jgi:glycerol-3-phosphate dehydrogenase
MLKTRDESIQKILNTKKWDIVVIGGGASGLGVALDAVSRGLSCLLVEKEDFGSGTSSKSTKLIHGGVRYLAQGYISLVKEALRERSYFLDKAHHVSDVQKFIIPAHGWYEAVKYMVGLMIYDLLAINKSLGKTKWISAKETKEIFPTLNTKNLVGGIEYTDGKFDDARMCIDLVNTIFDHKGICINYMSCTGVLKSENKIKGIRIRDKYTGIQYEIEASAIINATGVYATETMQKADEHVDIKIIASQGSHLVFNKSITKSEYGLMIPKTSDGRVLFAIPWKNKLLVGTTDIQQQSIAENPKPNQNEVNFILENLQSYCGAEITKNDISTTFAGLRPLAAPKEGKSKSKEISRSHKVVVSPSGLISIIGGKWTTFRKMGQDTIEVASKMGFIAPRMSSSEKILIKAALKFENHSPIHPELPYNLNDFQNIIEKEMVESIDDLLSRRTRCTFISLKATKSIYLQILELLATTKNWTQGRKEQDKKYFEEKYFSNY